MDVSFCSFGVSGAESVGMPVYCASICAVINVVYFFLRLQVSSACSLLAQIGTCYWKPNIPIFVNCFHVWKGASRKISPKLTTIFRIGTVFSLCILRKQDGR